jgi:hypothetical protein
MSIKYYLFFVYLTTIISCNAQNIQEKSKYLKSVGDIEYNDKTDKKDFYLCNENDIMQYHNDYEGLQYKGEKIAIIDIFNKQYIPINNEEDNGLIRIRFVVNCKGETDRFRLISMDYNYKEKIFSQKVTKQLLSICMNLDGWIPKKLEGKQMDYYQYLIFKIKNGQIIEIMP